VQGDLLGFKPNLFHLQFIQATLQGLITLERQKPKQYRHVSAAQQKESNGSNDNPCDERKPQ